MKSLIHSPTRLFEFVPLIFLLTWFSCEATLPIYVRVAWLIGTFIAHLPAEEISMLAGLVLCFFGGMYPLTLAAAEALRQCGK